MKNIFKDVMEELSFISYDCMSCFGERLNDDLNFLCKDCYKRLVFIKDACEVCGGKVEKDRRRVCEMCAKEKRNFDKNLNVFSYEGTAKNLVYNLKIKGIRKTAKSMGLFLAKRLKDENLPKIDYILNVPILRKTYLERGFNHTELLGEEVSKLLKLNFKKNAILKIKDTPLQVELKKEEREKNLKGAFFVDESLNLKDKIVVVIDDVMTTGSTINEISKLLKKRGVQKVYGLTFCHT